MKASHISLAESSPFFLNAASPVSYLRDQQGRLFWSKRRMTARRRDFWLCFLSSGMILDPICTRARRKKDSTSWYWALIYFLYPFIPTTGRKHGTGSLLTNRRGSHKVHWAMLRRSSHCCSTSKACRLSATASASDITFHPLWSAATGGSFASLLKIIGMSAPKEPSHKMRQICKHQLKRRQTIILKTKKCRRYQDWSDSAFK